MKESCWDSYSRWAVHLKPVELQKMFPNLGENKKQPREVVMPSSEWIAAVVILRSSVKSWLMRGLWRKVKSAWCKKSTKYRNSVKRRHIQKSTLFVEPLYFWMWISVWVYMHTCVVSGIILVNLTIVSRLLYSSICTVQILVYFVLTTRESHLKINSLTFLWPSVLCSGTHNQKNQLKVSTVTRCTFLNISP